MLPSTNQHNIEIQANLDRWNSKPLLRKIYRSFHELIASVINRSDGGITVELGSGIGNIKEVIPDCLRTDLFANPWIDQTENAYQLSFANNSVSNLILFDVFHHLRYPGTAIKEFSRVLIPGGRVIIFDPCISLLGFLVYGLGHHEPIAIFSKIDWLAASNWRPENDSYYAAQGNAYRIFFGRCSPLLDIDLSIKIKKRYSSLSYVASGGYSQRQLYPSTLYPFIKWIDRVCDFLPLLFATRLLVVLEKKKSSQFNA